MEDEEIDIFNENVIIDYIYSYQKDKEQAKKNLNSAFKNYYNYVTLENRMHIRNNSIYRKRVSKLQL